MEKLGKTGTFPKGKMHASDEGAITFGCGVKDGNVILDFGTPVVWLGMPPQLAADLASLLLTHARSAASDAGQSITFSMPMPSDVDVK